MNEVGEIQVGGTNVIEEYLGGTFAERFSHYTTGTWFRTGDVGLIDVNGVVHITGRLKDIPSVLQSKIQSIPLLEVRSIRHSYRLNSL